MNIRKIAVTRSGQDGAIYGDLLFRFDHLGKGAVYDLSPLKNQEQCEPCELPVLSELMLDRVQELAPHSNSVVFGSERFDPSDELPLLYTNIYNNYAKAENPLVGVCCVYRVLREGNCFSTRLVQCIEIGFTNDAELWRSGTDTADVRPYGNFVIDPTADRYYAFVMRDAASSVRYFSFRLPRLSEGVPHPTLGIPWVTLTHSDVLGFFDTPYHNYIQGAAVAPDGRIYSVEGFGKNPHPAIRIINPRTKTQEFFFDFYEAGLPIEAEMVDFYYDRCFYGDAHGNLFELTLLP